ncbi:hypothetical protein V5N11_020828 [Cardamine amara subsp. amara]|uniref:Uncharacterized protein n=1 Tax=Cardamine amara subsp. amara TaxID=228776 RepID=A0ABD1AI54_CARAN
MCARHIYGNLRSKFPGKSRIKPLFWAVAESYNKADYDIAIEAVKRYDIAVFEAMMAKNPKNCSRAFFKTTSTCEDVHNNFSESYNSAINKARSLPLVEMLETVRRQCMFRIDARKAKSIKHRGKYSLKVAEMIAEEEKELKSCQLIPGANGLFEVNEKGCSYALNLTVMTALFFFFFFASNY